MSPPSSPVPLVQLCASIALCLFLSHHLFLPALISSGCLLSSLDWKLCVFTGRTAYFPVFCVVRSTMQIAGAGPSQGARNKAVCAAVTRVRMGFFITAKLGFPM